MPWAVVNLAADRSPRPCDDATLSSLSIFDHLSIAWSGPSERRIDDRPKRLDELDEHTPVLALRHRSKRWCAAASPLRLAADVLTLASVPAALPIVAMSLVDRAPIQCRENVHTTGTYCAPVTITSVKPCKYHYALPGVRSLAALRLGAEATARPLSALPSGMRHVSSSAVHHDVHQPAHLLRQLPVLPVLERASAQLICTAGAASLSAVARLLCVPLSSCAFATGPLGSGACAWAALDRRAARELLCHLSQGSARV